MVGQPEHVFNRIRLDFGNLLVVAFVELLSRRTERGVPCVMDCVFHRAPFPVDEKKTTTATHKSQAMSTTIS